MRRFAKQRMQLPLRAPRAYWPSKWKLRLFTRLPVPRTKTFYALAHVTNTMAVAEQDFEKGEADGTVDALRVLEAVIDGLQP